MARRIRAAIRFSRSDVMAERHGACLPYGFDLAHDRNDVKPGAEGARELDCRQQRLPAGYLIVEVNGE